MKVLGEATAILAWRYGYRGDIDGEERVFHHGPRRRQIWRTSRVCRGSNRPRVWQGVAYENRQRV